VKNTGPTSDSSHGAVVGWGCHVICWRPNLDPDVRSSSGTTFFRHFVIATTPIPVAAGDRSHTGSNSALAPIATSDLAQQPRRPDALGDATTPMPADLTDAARAAGEFPPDHEVHRTWSWPTPPRCFPDPAQEAQQEDWQ